MAGLHEQSWEVTARKLRRLLKFYKAMGVENVFVPPELKQTFTEGPPRPKMVLDADDLELLRSRWGDCVRCTLHGSRTHLVFGEGNPHAGLMFVGEGPGAEEDRLGRPFVGNAGRLLTDIIEKGFKMQRSDVYIANIVKCRPPGNRDPQPEEIGSCIPLLWKQIELIKPQAIVALGKVAAQTILDTSEPISSLRGRFHKVKGFAVMPTYHPAYLLRNPGAKREVWEDIKSVMRAFPHLA